MSAGILLVDLDRFKRLNDSAGHLAGDDALRWVADALRHVTRTGDGIYRFGGEEFLVLLHACQPDELPFVAERLVRAVEAAAIAHPDNAPWDVVTVSAGAAPLVAGAIDASLRAADEALYAAKSSGRNRACVPAAEQPVAAPRVA